MTAHERDIVEPVVVGWHGDVAGRMPVEVLPGDETLTELTGDRDIPQQRHRRADLIELVILVLVTHRLEVQLSDGRGAPIEPPKGSCEGLGVRIEGYAVRAKAVGRRPPARHDRGTVRHAHRVCGVRSVKDMPVLGQGVEVRGSDWHDPGET